MQKQGVDWAVRSRMRKPGVLQALGTVAGLVLLALIYGMLIARPAQKTAREIMQGSEAMHYHSVTGRQAQFLEGGRREGLLTAHHPPAAHVRCMEA
jgi:hypothetical protein